MGNAVLYNKSGGGFSDVNGVDATFLAKDKLQVGDIVYTITGDIHNNTINETGLDQFIESMNFTPDGKMVVITGYFEKLAKYYKVNPDNTLTYIDYLRASASGSSWLNGNTSSCSISSDGTKMLVGGDFNGVIKLYSIGDYTITYVKDIMDADGTTALTGGSGRAAFSPDGTKFAIAGSFPKRCSLYSITADNTITYISPIYADAGTTTYTGSPGLIKWSPKGDALILGGAGFSNYCSIYSVIGNVITYVSKVPLNASGSTLNGYVWGAAFSPDGTKMLIGGSFTNRCSLFNISGTTLTYIGPIYADNAGTIFDSDVKTIKFSGNGELLAIGGEFTGKAKLYSMYNNTVKYLGTCYNDWGTNLIPIHCRDLAISPNGDMIVVGGTTLNSVPLAKMYSISRPDYKINYINNIPSKYEVTYNFSQSCYAIAISPDGTKVILGFIGNYSYPYSAKLYDLKNGTLNYITDIYANNDKGLLNGSIYAIAFTQDGTGFILLGSFSKYAKFYKIVNNMVLYISDIYADTGTTALSDAAQSAAFSPDGTKLIIGGNFNGKCKLYTVTSNAITFVSNILLDGSSAMDDAPLTIAWFTSGNRFVLGGNFSGKARVYDISGTTVTHKTLLYADSGTTLISAGVTAVCVANRDRNIYIGGSFTGVAKSYYVANDDLIRYSADIKQGSTALGGYIYSMALSPDNTILILGGTYGLGDYIKLYSITGDKLAFISTIDVNLKNEKFNGNIVSMAFTPDGKNIIIGGEFTDKVKMYRVFNTKDQYGNTIRLESSGSATYDGSVANTYFSPDGSKYLMVGDFNGKARLQTANHSYITQIYGSTGTSTPLNYNATCGAWSPDGTKLIVGGRFYNNAKFYTVSGDTVTYVSDLKADTAGTVFNDTVNVVAWSPDGSKVIIGVGTNAKLYTVTGNTISYTSEITYLGGDTWGGEVKTIAFSPNGDIVMIGGVNGVAAMYYISGNFANLITIIYKTGGGVLDGSVYSMSFNQDKTLLAVGGSFTGYCKIYSVSSNNALTFITDIPGLDNSVTNVAFCPTDNTLVISGDFTNNTKVFTFGPGYVPKLEYTLVVTSAAQTIAWRPNGTYFQLNTVASKGIVRYGKSSVVGIKFMAEAYKLATFSKLSLPYYNVGVGYVMESDIEKDSYGTVRVMSDL